MRKDKQAPKLRFAGLDSAPRYGAEVDRMIVESPPYITCKYRTGVVSGMTNKQSCKESMLGKAIARKTMNRLHDGCDTRNPESIPIEVARKVYIAGGSTERVEVGQKWIQRAREAGISIVFDWTVCSSYNPNWLAGFLEKNVHKAWQHVARRDFDAVMASDIVWILVPEKLSEGAATELGIALAARALAKRRMTLVASGKSVHRNLFSRLADAQFGSHEAAFEYVRGLCGLRDGEPKESPQYRYAP